MVLYATDHEKRLIIRALSYYARHAAPAGGVIEQVRQIVATITGVDLTPTKMSVSDTQCRQATKMSPPPRQKCRLPPDKNVG